MISQTLLTILFDRSIISIPMMSHYKYICRYNNLDFNFKDKHQITDIFSLTYANILILNQFSLFTQKNICNLLNRLSNKIHMVIQQECHFPLVSMSFYIKNCDWSKKLIEDYIHSGIINFKQFLQEYSLDTCQHILKCDDIAHFSNIHKYPIIENHIDQHHSVFSKRLNTINNKLGIIT